MRITLAPKVERVLADMKEVPQNTVLETRDIPYDPKAILQVHEAIEAEREMNRRGFAVVCGVRTYLSVVCYIECDRHRGYGGFDPDKMQLAAWGDHHYELDGVKIFYDPIAPRESARVIGGFDQISHMLRTS